MFHKRDLRRHVFIDPKIQGALVARAVLYWVVCLMTITLMLLCWRVLTGPVRLFHQHLVDLGHFYAPALVASLLLLPVVIIDVVRLSNRFVGPLLRLRRSMRQLAQGEPVEPITFRNGDFWREFATEFNAVVTRVQAETPSPPAAPEGDAQPQPAAVGGE